MSILPKFLPVPGTDYEYSAQLQEELLYLQQRVGRMRDLLNGPLDADFVVKLREWFRIRNIYHSNAIEGSQLTIGETRLVVEQGLTISGKPLEDSLAASNLAHALDYFEQLATRSSEPILARDVRLIHQAVLKDIDDRNAGMYRTGNVVISGSAYPPPDANQVPAEMGRFTDWLKLITAPDYSDSVDPLSLACAAHAWFVRIHPFIDGNGRTARLIMNLILIRRGYPLTIIPSDSRLRYYEALEESQTGDLTPFLQFVHELTADSMDEYETLANAQQATAAAIQGTIQALISREQMRQTAEFEIYQSAMNLLKAAFRQVSEAVSAASTARLTFSVTLKDFGSLDFEKFQTLQASQSAQRTWFFRLDCTVAYQTTRWLFFFGYASRIFRQSSSNETYNVTLFAATETTPFFYELLNTITADGLPDVYEIGYDPASEHYLALKKDEVVPMRAEELAREFIGIIS